MAKIHLFVICSVLFFLIVACSATVYMVGDSSGWDISTDLNSWVAGKRFVVGDVLMFQYASSDSVCELTQKEFEGCNTTNPLLKDTSGNTTFSLSKPGERYFACCNRLYCLGGMKFHVHVEGNLTAAPIGAPAEAPAPAKDLPKTSKSSSSNPSVPSSAAFNRIGAPLVLFMLGYVGFWLLGGTI